MIIKCVKIMIVHTMLNIKCYFCSFWHFCTIISHIWFWSELKIRKKWFWQQWNTNKHDEANVKLMIVVGWYTNTRFYFVHSSVQPQNGHLNRLNFKSESMWDGFSTRFRWYRPTKVCSRYLFMDLYRMYYLIWHCKFLTQLLITNVY